MNILWFIPITLTLLVTFEVVNGSAFSLRTKSVFHGGMDQFDSRVWVDREENAAAFWVIVTKHACVIALVWWLWWDHLW